MQLHLELAWTRPPPASPTSPWPPHINKWPSWAPAGLPWGVGGRGGPRCLPSLSSQAWPELPHPGASFCPAPGQLGSPGAPPPGEDCTGAGTLLPPGQRPAAPGRCRGSSSSRLPSRRPQRHPRTIWAPLAPLRETLVGIPLGSLAMRKLDQGRRGLPKGLAGKPQLPAPVLSPHATAGAPASPRLWLGGPRTPWCSWGGVEVDSSSPRTAHTPGTAAASSRLGPGEQ